MKNKLLALLLSLSVLSSAPVASTPTNAISNHLNIAVQFGNSELARYGVPSTFLNRFPRIETVAIDKFLWAFGIELDFNYGTASNQIITTVADTCKNHLSAQYNLCAHKTAEFCSNNGPYHHTNIQVIKNDISTQFTFNYSDTVVMYMTPIALCRVSNTSGHGRLVGVAWENSNFIITRDYDFEDGVYTNLNDYPIKRIAAVVVHEIGHLYGVKDHSTGVANCLWGANNGDIDVQENLTICAPCGATIRENANKFNHS